MKDAYLIAETAYSFEGSLDYLLESVENVPDSVSALKFHLLFNTNEYMVKQHSLQTVVNKWLLSKDDWLLVFKKVKRKGKDVIVLADDLVTVEFLEKAPELVDGIEVHAACVNDINILSKALGFASNYKKRFYLGISGFEFYELKKIIRFIKQFPDVQLVLMYGFQNYPTKLENLQLNKIQFYKSIFDCEIGYADHTQADWPIKDDIICAVYATGVSILEIHYVNTFCDNRTDAITAYDPEHFKNIYDIITAIKNAFGEFDIELNEGELNYLNFRKVPVYARNLKQGAVLRPTDICFKRVEKAKVKHCFQDYERFIGMKVKCDVGVDSEIVFEDFCDDNN